MSVLLQTLKVQKRQSDLEKACTNSFWLATEILKYDRLTTSFHQPMMDEMDERDRRRPLVKIWNPGIALKGRGYVKDEMEMWPRDHYKTTVFITRCIKFILIYPDVAIALWHKVEEKAQEAAAEIGNHFLKNDDLRRLKPEIMPSKQARRFLTASGFTVRRSSFRRHPTIYAKGAGATVVGGHSDIGWLDDIIDQDTVNEGQMPKVRGWIGDTVSNVVRTDGGFKWCSGTPWDEHDVYEDFEKSPDWEVRVRACMETDGQPDYQGTPVLYDQNWLDKKRRNPHINFPLQMMCDRSMKAEKAWVSATCENYLSLKEASGPGYVVVIGDTAPRNIGSASSDKEKYRGDGKKDFWANAVVKLRKRGSRNEIILLDGCSSRDWDWYEGFCAMAKLQMKWHAQGIAIENKGQQWKDMISSNLRNACRDMGAKYHPIELTSTDKGKNARFGLLAARAAQDEFLICDTVPKDFLDRFLAQCREYRALPGNKNSLQNDDEVDCVGYACDPAFALLFPTVKDYLPLGPLDELDREPDYVSRSRYCAV